MTTRVVAFVPALAILLAPSAAFAQSETSDGKTRLAVITRVYGAGSDRAAGFISHYMRQTLGKDDRYELVELSSALGDPTVEAARTQLENAEKLSTQGRLAFEELELDRAMESLNAAIREYDRYAAYITDFRPLAETLMLLGITHLFQGETARGRERLAQAVVLEPTIEPDARYFNPSQRATFSRVRNRMLKARRGSLIVETEPSGAEIYIDGKFIGVSPETVLDVVEGRHYVRVVKDGYRPFGTVVKVKGTVEITDRAVLPPTKAFTDFDRLCDQVFEALNRGKRPREVETLLGQLATLLNTDDLLMQEVRIDGEQVRVLAGQMNLSGKLRSRVRETRFVYDADGDSYARRIAKFAADEFGPAPVEEERGSGPGGMRWDGEGLLASASPTCAGMNCDSFRSNFLIIGTASAVGIAGVGGIFGYLAGQDNDEFQETPQVDPNLDSIENGGKTRALIADILYGTAAAVALTSLGVYLFYSPSTSAEEVLDSGYTRGLGLIPLEDGGGMLTGTWNF